jgi:hypothetical protein
MIILINCIYQAKSIPLWRGEIRGQIIPSSIFGEVAYFPSWRLSGKPDTPLNSAMLEDGTVFDCNSIAIDLTRMNSEDRKCPEISE